MAYQSSTLSPKSVKAGVGRYGWRSRSWDSKRGLASECSTCRCPHLTEAEARVGRCRWCAAQDGTTCPTCSYAADLFNGEPAQPSLSDLIDNLEAARERVAKLDAMADGQHPVKEAQAGTWDEGCKPWEFFCKGCGRTRPGDERVEAYIKRGCRIVATLELCRDCGSQVSVCVRG